MKGRAGIIAAVVVLGFHTMPARTQTAPAPAATPAAAAVQPSPEQMEQQIKAISAALAATRVQMEQSQKQMQLLEQQLQQLQTQMAAAGGKASTTAAASTAAPAATPTPEQMQEHLEMLDAQVKQHEQAKVESSSRYPIRFTGLILFNSFVNLGVVDNIDMPAIANRATLGVNSGNVGASMRQTILGVEGFGPKLWGARTSASVSFDFFSGVSYSNFGTSAGTVRMRTGSIMMNWQNNTVEAGMVGPLISPLSPDSYATVAEPGMAWAGNLWTWAPQISYEHRTALANGNHLGMQFGLWDSPSAGYSTNEYFRAASPGELAMQPAYEGRISYAGKDPLHGLEFGFGGYYSRQSYPSSKSLDAWATTADWRVPLPAKFLLTGEAYRGRSVGGLGGGVYKDFLSGTSPVSGASVMRGLNAVGGWSQLTWRPNEMLEANATIGQDAGLASDFHALILPANASSTQLRARNQMLSTNFIYRPKTYLILSPEYRRIWTWPIIGTGSTADIFTLSIGYQF